jgi:cytidyltransferase-like protein
MKHVKLFEQFINEADVTQPIEGEEVVVMPGRFQPFHNGHIAALKNAAKIFGKPVIAMQIVSKRNESPFPESLLLQIGQEVAKNEKEIADFFIYPNSYGRTVIPWFVRFLREQGYETVGVGAGSDRIKAYTPQIKYVTGPKTDTIVHPDFKLEMVDARAEGGPSGTKTREALTNDDREAFEKMVPSYLYKYYNKLRKHV